MDSIFTGPVWILVGHESEIPNPGDYKTTSVGTIPVIVVRGTDGVVRVLVNACAHRGTRLVEGPSGNVGRAGFSCIYHMWTYDTSGDLTGVSLPEDFPGDFRKEDYGLPPARVDTYKGAIFATFKDTTPPLREYLAELTDGLDQVLGDGALRTGFQWSGCAHTAANASSPTTSATATCGRDHARPPWISSSPCCVT